MEISMTQGRGLMSKSPNTPFDTLKEIELKLQDKLKRQADGRWKYPPKENDETLAREIGKGATLSAVGHMRRDKYPGGLVPQQIRPRPPAAILPPEMMDEPVTRQELHDLIGMIQNNYSEFIAFRDALRARSADLKLPERVTALEERYTRPSDH
jgi:hypothetical protein